MQADESHKKIIRLIRDLAGAILAGLLLVLLVNRGVLMHANDGIGRNLWIADSGNSTTVVSHDGSVHLSLDAFETGIYTGRLSFELENFTEKPLSLGIRVSCLRNASHLTEYEYTDFQPLYLGNEVLTVDREHVVAVDIYPVQEEEAAAEGKATAGTDDKGFPDRRVDSAPVFRIGEIRIDNRFQWDPYVLLFGFLSAFALLLLIDHRAYFHKRPAAAFCLIALTMGFSIVTGLPRNKIGYDEETHLQAVMDLASFPSGELHVSDALLNQLLITEYNHPDAQPGNYPEMAEWDARLGALADYRLGEHTPDFYTLPNRVPAYLPMAAAMKLGKGLHLSWPELLTVTRAANLLMYTAVMTLAVWLAPAGQWLMMLIGLFPVSLFLACTVSYDPFVTAFLFLGYACLMRGRRWSAAALVCFFLGCLPKAVYAPVALLPMIWLNQKHVTAPTAAARDGKAGGQSPEKGALADFLHPDTADWLLLFGCGLCFILLAGTFILPTLVSPAEVGDVRGGATSEVSQVGFILGNPLRYAAILLRQIILWVPQCWFGADCTTHMGHIVNGYTRFKGYYPVYLFLLAGTVIASWRGGRRILVRNTEAAARKDEITINVDALHLPARIWTFMMVGAASVLIWTSMYVAFTEPGASEIAGVQGRYFLPLMFPLYMVLSGPAPSPDASLETKPRLWYYLLELAGLTVLSLTVWTTVISRFCL